MLFLLLACLRVHYGADCATDLDCPTGVCDADKLRCSGECSFDQECPAGSTCDLNGCVRTCGGDAECTLEGQICDETFKVCVDGCHLPDDCEKGQYCEIDDTCKPGCDENEDCEEGTCESFSHECK